MSADDKLLALEIIARICRICEVKTQAVFGRCRVRQLCDIRAIIARILHDLRYTLKDIGSLLNRSHTTIWFLIEHTYHYADLTKRMETIKLHLNI